MNDKMNAFDNTDATVTRGAGMNDTNSFLTGKYLVTCRDANGNIKWEEDFNNTVTDEGKKFVLDTIFAGSAWTTIVHMGLYKSGSPGTTSTMTGFVAANETTAYAARVSLSGNWSAASGATTVSKALSAAKAISMTNTDTILGCFIVLNGSATIANTTGSMYSIGAFSSSKSVVNGDTINVSYTTQL